MAAPNAAGSTSVTGQPALETAVREYRRTRDYERDMRERRQDGWRVVSVLQRPGPPAGVRRVVIGSGLAKPDTEYLVTYTRVPQPDPQLRPLQWLLDPRLVRRHSSRWIWSVAALLLVALLIYGFLDFFADAVPF
ncbi:MAG TPA: hypothetical protein VNM48_13585 [Chloroflexota bacterium]|nr:hypothetical protein [Chloroflexota bacterium]